MNDQPFWENCKHCIFKKMAFFQTLEIPKDIIAIASNVNNTLTACQKCTSASLLLGKYSHGATHLFEYVTNHWQEHQA
jgi:heterodisulfide reductase subunit B